MHKVMTYLDPDTSITFSSEFGRIVFLKSPNKHQSIFELGLYSKSLGHLYQRTAVKTSKEAVQQARNHQFPRETEK